MEALPGQNQLDATSLSIRGSFVEALPGQNQLDATSLCRVAKLHPTRHMLLTMASKILILLAIVSKILPTNWILTRLHVLAKDTHLC